MPTLLFYLMFSIGTQGKFIPNENIKHIRMNPTKIMMECMHAVLDVVWIMNSESISEHEIENFSSKCNLMNYKLEMLWSLKQKITQSSKKLSVVKCHLCMHLPYNWSQFGCLKDIDTA
jgi:hypothetical protein